MTHCDPYPAYSRNERIADCAVHIAGIAFAVLGAGVLIFWTADEPNVGIVAALCIYAAAMIASFVASFCYHFTPWEGPRPLLRRIDHAAIYFKIAGTYTPLVVLIGSTFAYWVLGLVWTLALFGAAMKLFFWARTGRWNVGLYLGLGWLSVALATSLIPCSALTVCGSKTRSGTASSSPPQSVFSQPSHWVSYPQPSFP